VQRDVAYGVDVVGDDPCGQWLSRHSGVSCVEFDSDQEEQNRELSESEKAFNRALSRRRMVIENINAQIKVFKIMSYPYRNHRRRHLLRTKLICAILNAEKA
jgi:hypothetical protein